MKGLSINNEEDDNDLYCEYLRKHGELKFLPKDLVVAMCSPSGVKDSDLTGAIFIVKFVGLELEADELNGDIEQPDDLPYYLCKQANGSEYLFTADELMRVTPDQESCLLKESIYKGYTPNIWSFDLYDRWL